MVWGKAGEREITDRPTQSSVINIHSERRVKIYWFDFGMAARRSPSKNEITKHKFSFPFWYPNFVRNTFSFLFFVFLWKWPSLRKVDGARCAVCRTRTCWQPQQATHICIIYSAKHFAFATFWMRYIRFSIFAFYPHSTDARSSFPRPV